MTADMVNLLEYSFLFTVVSSPVTQAQLDVTSHLKKQKLLNYHSLSKELYQLSQVSPGTVVF